MAPDTECPQLIECGMFEGCLRAVNKVIGNTEEKTSGWPGEAREYSRECDTGAELEDLCVIAMAGLAVGGRRHLWRGNSQSRGAE